MRLSERVMHGVDDNGCINAVYKYGAVAKPKIKVLHQQF
jgi:hypothetical protein